MNKFMNKAEIYKIALEYVKYNPDRFNDKEKARFMQGLKDCIDGKSNVIDDEVYDFLAFIGLTKQTREDQFLNYVNTKYGIIRFKSILDVGAGRMCKLSKALAEYGNTLYAMDPEIRLSKEEARESGIRIRKQNFICDKFAIAGQGTDIRKYDYIFGIEPCGATEHIIRQGLKYDKPFDVSLCAAPHMALNGRTFRNYEEWYEYLLSISDDVDIKKYDNSYYATNMPAYMKMEREKY